MAVRPAFCISPNQQVIAKQIEFQWISGLSFQQKQKNADSLQNAVKQAFPDASPLEISTKSRNELGIKLSAFNLKYQGYPLECVYQSSKVFQHGGAFKDLLQKQPREAKSDKRLKESGELIAFYHDGITWALEPKTAFFDFIYISAVRESLKPDEIQQIAEYNCFTDIEFNPENGINTQARTVAEIRLMLELYDRIPDFNRKEFLVFYQNYIAD
ncbi:MAG: hypothetical protein IJ644_04765 [Oscillospiraceae bacterium]|nr:hypothetical protein [Oscillospiraceae bacterium]